MKQVSWSEVGGKALDLLSPAYKSNGLVFTSGNVGINAEGEIVEGLVEQTELAIANLKTVLEASGSGLEKVLKVLLFISDPKDNPKVNEIYAKYFTHKPARSCVVVAFPNPNIKVELECVAEAL